jgi:hypothetical protein
MGDHSRFLLSCLDTSGFYASNLFCFPFLHPWLISHYFTVCTNNGKSFGKKGGGVNLLVNMMDTVIVGMVTPSSHYFRCPYSIYQLHYVILLFTLASGRYLVSYKTPITYVTNRFCILDYHSNNHSIHHINQQIDPSPFLPKRFTIVSTNSEIVGY